MEMKGVGRQLRSLILVSGADWIALRSVYLEAHCPCKHHLQRMMYFENSGWLWRSSAQKLARIVLPFEVVWWEDLFFAFQHEMHHLPRGFLGSILRSIHLTARSCCRLVFPRHTFSSYNPDQFPSSSESQISGDIPLATTPTTISCSHVVSHSGILPCLPRVPPRSTDGRDVQILNHLDCTGSSSIQENFC
jgi:hypothetical protein